MIEKDEYAKKILYQQTKIIPWRETNYDIVRCLFLLSKLIVLDDVKQWMILEHVTAHFLSLVYKNKYNLLF